MTQPVEPDFDGSLDILLQPNRVQETRYRRPCNSARGITRPEVDERVGSYYPGGRFLEGRGGLAYGELNKFRISLPPTLRTKPAENMAQQIECSVGKTAIETKKSSNRGARPVDGGPSPGSRDCWVEKYVVTSSCLCQIARIKRRYQVEIEQIEKSTR